jgi:hypothetical protein
MKFRVRRGLFFSAVAFLCTALLPSPELSAQGVKIGQDDGPPASSSILELESTSRGFLPPRMTTAERDLIQDPATGLVIYNTSTNCLNMWTGSSWRRSCFECDFDSPDAISPETVCEGTALSLSATLIPGATYQWTGPNGFVSSQRNPVIENVTLAASGSYWVTAALNGCTSQPQSTVTTVIARPTQPVASNSGPACVGSQVNFTAASSPTATYQWSGPEGFSSADQNPFRATIQLAHGGTYAVIANENGCASLEGSTMLSVITTPNAPGSISGPVNPCIGSPSNQYVVTEITGVTYTWNTPAGWNITSGQNTASVAVTAGTASGQITATPSNTCGAGPSSSLSVSVAQPATGGSTAQIPGYRVHTFTSGGTLQIGSCGLSNLEVLVVAGGGGGGCGWEGGGGGAGGVIYQSSYAVTDNQSISVTVGNGGAGGSNSGGANGGNSVFGTLTAIGGGGGGTWYNSTPGANGGSGGGSHQGNPPGQGTPGQGFAGGNGSTVLAAGGGGGAGGPGQNIINGTTGGHGGIGIQSSITGTPTYYAGGGGGSNLSAAPSGGLGGGGNGGSNSPVIEPQAGQPNTGGGGGGHRNLGGNGAAGGSGIVIVRYPVTL